jgi:hypothetical protein
MDTPLKKTCREGDETPRKWSVTVFAKGHGFRSSHQDDQINYFDHLDHLDETKDLAAKVIKMILNFDHLDEIKDLAGKLFRGYNESALRARSFASSYSWRERSRAAAHRYDPAR